MVIFDLKKSNNELETNNQFLNEKNQELIDAYKELQDKQRLDKEFKMAQKTQEEFLPTTMPQIKGYTFESYFKGARGVSGDFYDYR